jgi:hypothetical protein
MYLRMHIKVHATVCNVDALDCVIHLFVRQTFESLTACELGTTQFFNVQRGAGLCIHPWSESQSDMFVEQMPLTLQSITLNQARQTPYTSQNLRLCTARPWTSTAATFEVLRRNYSDAKKF